MECAFLTVEALYQACRFPHRPEVQRKIIEQTSPMTAKMVGKPFRNDSRPDWDRGSRENHALGYCGSSSQCTGPSLVNSWRRQGTARLLKTSRKDDFWGAIPTDSRTLVGMNVLGPLTDGA
jgi:predicted NAD-dependent protein-ADP-ribosyltransferase YbiA (DUF1768 family)